VPHYKTLIDTNFLGQWDLPTGRNVTVVIESVSRYKPARKQQKRDKATGKMVDEPNKRLDIGFRGKRKHWLAGPVSQSALANMFGPNTDNWIGKAIALYVDESVKMGGRVVGGVRVRNEASREEPTQEPLDNEPTQEEVDRLEFARDEVGIETKPPREAGED
jgi:hypothetical protein